MDTNETTIEQAITTTGQLLEVGGKLKPGSSIEVSAKIFKNAELAYDTAAFIVHCAKDPDGERLYWTEFGGKLIQGATFSAVLTSGLMLTSAATGAVEAGTGGLGTVGAAIIYAHGTSWTLLAASGASALMEKPAKEFSGWVWDKILVQDGQKVIALMSEEIKYGGVYRSYELREGRGEPTGFFSEYISDGNEYSYIEYKDRFGSVKQSEEIIINKDGTKTRIIREYKGRFVDSKTTINEDIQGKVISSNTEQFDKADNDKDGVLDPQDSNKDNDAQPDYIDKTPYGPQPPNHTAPPDPTSPADPSNPRIPQPHIPSFPGLPNFPGFPGFPGLPGYQGYPGYPGLPGGPDAVRIPFRNAENQRSPLVLDLDGDGVETTSLQEGTFFDHDDNGFAEQTAWSGDDDGILVYDRNNNGVIDSGAELFGDNTLLNDGSKASNGFEALAEFDENNDGVIDSNDAVYSKLKVGHRGTLYTLDELGIKSINVSYANQDITDENGNRQQFPLCPVAQQ